MTDSTFNPSVLKMASSKGAAPLPSTLRTKMDPLRRMQTNAFGSATFHSTFASSVAATSRSQSASSSG
jgi:hypothetical protein